MTPFRGRFEVKVDPKFRLALPVSFREACRDSKQNRLVITNGLYQGQKCLDVYTFAEWRKLETRISGLSQLNRDVQSFQRFYLSGGHVLEVDGQSRMLIPPSLRQYAGVDSQVVLVGFSNKFEIWAQDVWSQLFDRLAQDFEKTLAAVSEDVKKDV